MPNDPVDAIIAAALITTGRITASHVVNADLQELVAATAKLKAALYPEPVKEPSVYEKGGVKFIDG